MGSSGKEIFEPGLNRMNHKHSNQNVEVENKDESEGQRECKYIDIQTQNQTNMGVWADKLQHGLDLTDNMFDDTLSTIMNRNSSHCFYC